METLKPGVTYIYKSPYHGKTIYAREQSKPHDERFIIRYQYNLFEDIERETVGFAKDGTT